MKMIKYPSIEQFRSIVKHVTEASRYIGTKEDGTPIFDGSLPLPTLTFIGTVKLHGTNAGIGYNVDTGEIWAMSRENIITPEKDNAGFAQFVSTKEETFKNFFKKIIDFYSNKVVNKIDLTNCYLTINGEWAGKGIQKGVAISEIPKSFFIFGLKVTPKDEEQKSFWLDHAFTIQQGHGDVLVLSDPENSIYNIDLFDGFRIDIDFNNPQMAVNKMLEFTEQVENECPVAKDFGISGIGEGIVWSCFYKDSHIRFKTKGEKHSKSKVKVLAPVDNEKEKAKQELALKITPAWRIDQAIQEVFDTLNGGVPDSSKIGDVLKWVNQDIIKEELLTISEAGFEFKEVVKQVNNIVKIYFFGIINTYN